MIDSSVFLDLADDGFRTAHPMLADGHHRKNAPRTALVKLLDAAGNSGRSTSGAANRWGRLISIRAAGGYSHLWPVRQQRRERSCTSSCCVLVRDVLSRAGPGNEPRIERRFAPETGKRLSVVMLVNPQIQYVLPIRLDRGVLSLGKGN